jgi:hypothetical protein
VLLLQLLDRGGGRAEHVRVVARNVDLVGGIFGPELKVFFREKS